MCDLKKQIAEWRKNMAKASGRRGEALDELEAHLREEIERLLQTGTPREQVLEAALSNLGPPAALAAEFDKVVAGGKPKWKPATIAQWLCIAIALLLALFLIPRISNGRMGLLLASHVLTLTIGYTLVFILGALGICYALTEWFGGTGPSQRTAFHSVSLRFATAAGVLTLIGIILGMFWAKENWGRFWTWDAKETGALFVVASALVTLTIACLRPANPRALAFAAIIGNVCTAWGWFGANTAFKAAPLLVAFTVSQCLLLAAIPFMAHTNRFRAKQG